MVYKITKFKNNKDVKQKLKPRQELITMKRGEKF